METTTRITWLWGITEPSARSASSLPSPSKTTSSTRGGKPASSGRSLPLSKKRTQMPRKTRLAAQKDQAMPAMASVKAAKCLARMLPIW